MNFDYMAINFNNGMYAVKIKKPDMTVKAVKDIDHGDWKTQSVRNEFMGMRKGEEGKLVEIWENMYGRWCRVDLGKRKCDVTANDLEVVEDDK